MNKDFRDKKGIYVHIPFCASKCIYCDFLSFPGLDGYQDRYFKSLLEEINYKKEIFEDQEITSIFIGGGTPSVVKAKYIANIIEKLKASFKLASDIEITIEINPGTVNEDSLRVYKDLGINRLSFGLQSMDNDILKFLGRLHTKEDFQTSLKLARQVGFVNINADLLIGLPNQSLDVFKRTVKDLASLDLPHISAYSLILEEETKIYKMLEAGHIQMPSEELDRQMYWYLLEYLNAYKHYEISNFAKEGYQCDHNLLYWETYEYLAFGLGASSYINSRRYRNTSSLGDYLKYDFRKFDLEDLNEIDRMKEFMMLGFRMIAGPNPDLFMKRFNKDYRRVFKKEINKLLLLGLIKENHPGLSLSSKGLDLANRVFMEFV